MSFFGLQRVKETALCVLPAILPLVVVLLITPSTIYINNQDYFNYKFLLLYPFYWTFCIGGLAIALLLFVLPKAARCFVSALFLFAGLYLLISEFLTPLDVGDIIHGTELVNIPEPATHILIDVGLALAALVLALLVYKKRFQGIASFLVVGLLAINAYDIHANLADGTKWSPPPAPTYLPDPEPASQGPNCYHLFFDAYNRDLFLQNIDELGIRDDFDGFIFYENNLSNGWWTTDSIPSIMTGTLYDGSIPHVTWLQRWYMDYDPSIFRTLYKNKYRVNFYSSHPEWYGDFATSYLNPEHISAKAFDVYRTLQIMDMTVLRLVPTYFQNEVIRDGAGIFSWLAFNVESRFNQDAADAMNKVLPAHKHAYSSLPLVDSLIKDEIKRRKKGEYVFLASWLPHAPVIVDADCNYSPATGKEDAATFMAKYKGQAMCATRKLHQIIRALKEKGVYEDSLIVVHTDHGFSSFHDAALMVKPPGRAGVPLDISDRETMLLDIPATIYDALNLGDRAMMGQSVLSETFPSNRTIPMIRSRSDNDKIFSLSYQRGKGYEIHPSIIKKPHPREEQ